MGIRNDSSSEPLRAKGCKREKCLVCTNGEPGACERNGQGYRISCIECKLIGKKVDYEGETGRNCYTRGLEHQDDLRLEKLDTPLWKHCFLEHGGLKVPFYMKPLKGYTTCLPRLANEGVRVTINTADILMNSKNEFHQSSITRISIRSGLQDDQGGFRTA